MKKLAFFLLLSFPVFAQQINLGPSNPQVKGVLQPVNGGISGGPWINTSTYGQGAIVTFGGSTYLAVALSTNITPGTNPSFWTLLPGLIASSPIGTQIVTQPAGTTLNVNNFNSTYVINGNGVADNGPAALAAVTACGSGNTCRIQLVNSVINSTVVVPADRNITFDGVGNLSCTATTICFSRSTSVPTLVAFRVTFQNLNFLKSNAGVIIKDNLNFSSGGNFGMSIINCTFQLNASSVAYQTTGADFNIITHNTFNSSDGTGIAIQPMGISNVGVDSSQVSTVTDNTFRTMIALLPTSAVNNDAFEGWSFTGNHGFAAKFTVYRADNVNFINNEFVQPDFIVDSSNNVNFVGNYFDVAGQAGHFMLKLTNTTTNTFAIKIIGNSFDAASAASTSMVVFQNAGNGHITQQVNIMGNTYIGGSNSATNPIYGIVFGDATQRNIYLSGENFNFLYSCLHITATLDRSTIDRFEANSPVFYADGIASFGGNYLIANYLYQKFDIFVSGYLPTAGGTVNLASQWFTNGNTYMFPGYTSAIAVTAPDTCTTGASVSLGSTPLQGGRYVILTTGPTAPVGVASCAATVTLDGTVYVGPR